MFPLSVNQVQWELARAPLEIVEGLTHRHDLPELAARLMAGRGISIEESDDWLCPTLRASMTDPLSLKDMDRASARIGAAIQSQETVGIFGDYDVDGATSTALMVRYLKSFGLKPLYHIPDRIQEGYGPNVSALTAMADKGASLILTLDCGATSQDVFSKVVSSGLDIISLDHHGVECAPTSAYAHVNPNQGGDVSGYCDLAAVGVVFLTIVATNGWLRGSNSSLELPNPMAWLDLVALGTICDVVSLRGLNRAIVRRGLHCMASNSCPGLAALMNVVDVEPNDLETDASLVGFKIGPLLNAGGRIGRSELATRLLLTNDSGEGLEIAQELAKLNLMRRELQSAVEEEALHMMCECDEEGAVGFAVGEDWALGVLGIVAGRLCDRLARPVIVMSRDEDGKYSGSGRSVGHIDLGSVIREAAEQGLIVRGGGHARAAGLAMTRDQIPAAKAFLENAIRSQWEDDVRPIRTAKVDALVTPSGATDKLLDKLIPLGPFGEGNPEPKFVIMNTKPTQVRQVGAAHVKCCFKDDTGARLSAISFFSLNAPLGDALYSGKRLHVFGSLQKDKWRGNGAVQFLINDVIEL